jgi:hypothetical protein
MISEVSFQSIVSLLYCWGCGKAEHHGGKSLWWSKVAHLMVARKQRERQEGAADRIPLKDTFPIAYFL